MELRKAINQIRDNYFSPTEPGAFSDIVNSLLHHDRYKAFMCGRFVCLSHCKATMITSVYPNLGSGFFYEFSNISINPLTPNIKEQILLSCPHTFLIKVLGRRCQNTKKIHLEWSYPKFSWPEGLNKHWYYEEKKQWKNYILLIDDTVYSCM